MLDKIEINGRNSIIFSLGFFVSKDYTQAFFTFLFQYKVCVIIIMFNVV